MTVVDCTAPLNRYTCYGAIEVVAIIIIIIIKANRNSYAIYQMMPFPMNNLELTLTLFSRSHHSLMLDISQTATERP